MNPSPPHLFDRLLGQRSGDRRTDWFVEVSPLAYQTFYQEVRSVLGSGLDRQR